MRGLFITGTDTDVGKTFVTALIARELRRDGVRVGVFKPACSGAVEIDGQTRWQDVETLADSAGVDAGDQVCPLRFKAPLAPPLAARQENRSVDESAMRHGLLAWRDRSDVLLVEGVGGLLCPLTETNTVADFAAWTAFPVLVVARLGLGTINHTCLTIEAAQRRGLSIAGVILNDGDNQAGTPAARTNPDELERRLDIPVLGIVPFQGQSIHLRGHDMTARMAWTELAGCGICGP